MKPKKKFERISKGMITSFSQQNALGIDGVYRNLLNEDPQYIICESKYDTSKLKKYRGIKQMSAEWILDRLNDEVGREIADEIKEMFYMNPKKIESLVFNIKADNKSYQFKYINDLGHIKEELEYEG